MRNFDVLLTMLISLEREPEYLWSDYVGRAARGTSGRRKARESPTVVARRKANRAARKARKAQS